MGSLDQGMGYSMHVCEINMCHEMKLSGGFVNHQILSIMPKPRF